MWIADDVGGEDRRKLAFDALLDHDSLPQG
jgi:hypothetical protein